MKALVTGGAGFIGSNLVDALIERGFDVTVVDDLSGSTGEHLNPKAEFHKEDIREYDSIKNFFEGVDFVFHLAANPNMEFSIRQPKESHDINLNGTLNVLLAAKEASVKKLVYSASCAAYGSQPELPWREDMLPAPLQPYSVQKHVGELYAKSFHDVYGLPTVSLRYFNVFGPRQKMSGAYAPVMGIFMKQKEEGKPITITGDGSQTRDFVHVSDIVRANIAAALSGNTGSGEVINIGTGRNYSVLEIARIIGGEIRNIEPRIEVKHSRADNSIAKRLLGWEPTIDLIDWLKENKFKK